jgi:hypothetical protein
MYSGKKDSKNTSFTYFVYGGWGCTKTCFGDHGRLVILRPNNGRRIFKILRQEHTRVCFLIRDDSPF